MKGVALILLCAVALGQTDQQQKTSNNKTCVCTDGNVAAACALDGSQGELFKHQNCNQFYKCVNGQAVPYFCPANLVYNYEEKKCDWPVNDGCGNRTIVEITPCHEEADQKIPEVTPKPAPEPDSEDNDSVPGTCNCNPNKTSSICAVNSSHFLVAHENCNQFYKCNNSVPVTISCPAGLVYNPYIECCDWPQNVECGVKPVVEIDGENNGNGNNGSNGGTCNCNPYEASGICAAEGSDGILVAHENCDQFYKCNNSAPVTLSCPVGLVYNPYIEVCDRPENVKCGKRPIVVVDGGNNGNGNCDSSNGNGNEDSGSGDNDNGNGDNGGTCNCNPSEAPGICAVIGSGGTLVAHENCNQFYKCNNSVPVTISCPAGLVYNPYIECCDWPQNVECGVKPVVEIDGENNGNGNNSSNGGNCNPYEASGICAAEGSDGILVAHENCYQFYKCNNSAPVTISCPVGLVYNPYIEVCDRPENVKCGKRPLVVVDGGNNGNGNCDSSNGNGNKDSGSGDNDNGNGDNGGTFNCNPSEAPGICAVIGSGGTLVAHENCNQFYTCDNGAPVTISCPAGLVYNPYIKVCDWPENVECGDRPIVEVDEEDNGNGDNGNGNSNGDSVSADNGYGNGDNGSNAGTCNCNPSKAPEICAADGSDGILIANENCNQFYTCVDGAHIIISCPAGLLYNPYNEICDWPENVECGDRPIIKVDGGNNGNGENGDNNGSNGNSDNDNNGNGDNGNADNGSNGGTCNCNPSEAPKICAANGSDGTLIASENCNQFYTCDDGAHVIISCPAGLLYNPYNEICDWPENVECGDRPIVEFNGGNNGSNSNSDNDNNGNSENDNGNGDNGSNVGSGNCYPGDAPAICATGEYEGVLIAHEECNKFYKCSFGNPVAFSCPGGLHYNPYLKICDWSWRVECDERVLLEEDIDIEGDKNGAEGQTEQEDKENVIVGQNEGNKDPSQAPTICSAEGSNGVLVAHKNCNKFSVCSYGSPVVIDCPSNLLYNPSIEHCDWPMNVDCGNRVIPEVVLPESESNTSLCNSGQAPSICAGSDSNGKMIAHNSCAHYYVCFNGQPIVRSCPLGLYYEPVSKQCTTAVSCEGRRVSTFSLNKHIEARRGFF